MPRRCRTVDPRRRDTQGLGQRVRRDADGLQEILLEDLPGVCRAHAVLRVHDSPPSVIVRDLHVFRPCFRPSKAQAPWIVDPDTVLTSSVAGEGFQMVARRRSQKLQRDRRIQAGEHLAQQLGLSRSQLYSDALAAYLSERGAAAVTAKLNAVYAAQSSKPDPAFDHLQLTRIADETW